MCTSPNKMFRVEGYTPNGKPKFLFCNYNVDHVEMYKNGSYVRCESPEQSIGCVEVFRSFIEVPCGKCQECLFKRAEVWSQRLYLESLYHRYNYFLTFTYDDSCLPRSASIDEDTGEYIYMQTLRYEHIQKFLRSLRNKLEKQFGERIPITYFVSGEYGSSTFRPHYHMILMSDWEIPDLQFWKKSGTGYNMYNSKFIDSLWQKGFVQISEANKECMAYTARYCAKKLYDNSEFYSKFNMEQERSHCSCKPAIGLRYFLDHPEMIQKYKLYFGTFDGPIEIYPKSIRYFKKKRDEMDDVMQALIHCGDDMLSQEVAEAAELTRQTLTDLNYIDYLSKKAEMLKHRTRGIDRKM